MKAIWKGSLAFGLVNIPVHVYPASEDHSLEFHMLHKKDISPIRFARICKKEEREIPYSEIVKGFEYEKDSYVVIDEEDFKQADVKKTSTIEIQQFTNGSEINPIYYEKPYVLEPEKKSVKAYSLLYEALLKSKKVAIANFVFRNREHIGMILPLNGALHLIQMRYHSEIRSIEGIEFSKEKVVASELKMAISFIEQLSKPFSPEKYHDTYVESVMQIIEQKLKGEKRARKTKTTKVSYETRDLMNLLQESIKKTLHTENKKEKTKRTLEKPTKKRKTLKNKS